MEDEEFIGCPIQLDRFEMKDGSVYLEVDQRMRLCQPELDQLFHSDIDSFASQVIKNMQAAKMRSRGLQFYARSMSQQFSSSEEEIIVDVRQGGSCHIM